MSVHAATAGRRPPPAGATPLPLARDASVAAAFGVLLGHCLAHLRANEEGVRAGRNPEYLHQLRVGLRRLRSALRLYRPLLPAAHYAALAGESAALAAALGAARDWDVFLETTVRPLARSAPADPALARFRRRCQRVRQRERAAARAALAAPRYARFVDDVSAAAAAPAWRTDEAAHRLLALPLAAFASARLARRARRVVRRLPALATADAAARHRLRIAAKRLRYAVDFFRPLFARRAARGYARALAALQDALGRLNDCASARRLLDAVPCGRDAAAHARARTQALARIELQEHRALAALAAAGDALRAAPAFW